MRKKDGQTYGAGSAIVLGIPRRVVITAEALAKKAFNV
jgi:hypothetical protein